MSSFPVFAAITLGGLCVFAGNVAMSSLGAAGAVIGACILSAACSLAWEGR
jgi:hypothetical protein